VADTVRAEPRVLAMLIGSAGRVFDPAGCSLLQRDGTVRNERFLSGALDDSIRAGGQRLRVDHDEAMVLNGAFARIVEDARELKFQFTLRDGARERSVLEQIRCGRIRSCSMAFAVVRAQEVFRGAMVVEYGRATLTEISLLTVAEIPAWYGTSISAVSI
jgi:HK97 family phage prohead protease